MEKQKRFEQTILVFENFTTMMKMLESEMDEKDHKLYVDRIITAYAEVERAIKEIEKNVMLSEKYLELKEQYDKLKSQPTHSTKTLVGDAKRRLFTPQTEWKSGEQNKEVKKPEKNVLRLSFLEDCYVWKVRIGETKIKPEKVEALVKRMELPKLSCYRVTKKRKACKLTLNFLYEMSTKIGLEKVTESSVELIMRYVLTKMGEQETGVNQRDWNEADSLHDLVGILVTKYVTSNMILSMSYEIFSCEQLEGQSMGKFLEYMQKQYEQYGRPETEKELRSLLTDETINQEWKRTNPDLIVWLKERSDWSIDKILRNGHIQQVEKMVVRSDNRKKRDETKKDKKDTPKKEKPEKCETDDFECEKCLKEVGKAIKHKANKGLKLCPYYYKYKEGKKKEVLEELQKKKLLKVKSDTKTDDMRKEQLVLQSNYGPEIKFTWDTGAEAHAITQETLKLWKLENAKQEIGKMAIEGILGHEEKVNTVRVEVFWGGVKKTLEFAIANHNVLSKELIQKQLGPSKSDDETNEGKKGGAPVFYDEVDKTWRFKNIDGMQLTSLAGVGSQAEEPKLHLIEEDERLTRIFKLEAKNEELSLELEKVERIFSSLPTDMKMKERERVKELLKRIAVNNSKGPFFKKENRDEIELKIELTEDHFEKFRKPNEADAKELNEFFDTVTAKGYFQYCDTAGGIETRELKACVNPVVIWKLKPDGTWKSGVAIGAHRMKLKSTIDAKKLYVPSVSQVLSGVKPNWKKFMVVDLKKAYYQLRIAEKSKVYTGTYTSSGKVGTWNVVPYGYEETPALFHRAANILFRKAKDFIRYFDDLFTGATEEQGYPHLVDELEILTEICEEEGLELEIGKFQIGNQVKVLGHLLTEKGWTQDPSKLEGLKCPNLLNAKAEQGKEQLRKIMGLLRYLQEYNANRLGENLARFNKKVSTKSVWEWNKTDQEALEEIVKLAKEKMVLAIPDPSRQLYIKSDASDYGIGGYIYHLNEESKEEIIGFVSKTFHGAEKNYHTIEKETLALLTILDQYQQIIRGKRVIAYVDQRPLVWTANMLQRGKCSKRLFSWFNIISMFNLDIRHIPGSENIVADALSRIQGDESEQQLESDTKRILSVFDYGHQLTPKWILDGLGEWGKKVFAKTLSTFDPFPYQIYTFDTFESNWHERIKLTGEEVKEVFVVANPPFNKLEETISKVYKEKVDAIIIAPRDFRMEKSKTMKSKEQSLEIYNVKLKLIAVSETEIENLPLFELKTDLNEEEVVIGWRLLAQGKVETEAIEREEKKKEIELGKTFLERESREQVLQEIHSSPLGLHGNVRQTLEIVQQRYWWPSLIEDVEAFVRSCVICQKTKAKPGLKGDNHPFPTNGRFNRRIHLDIVEMEEDGEGFKYILNVTDSATKLTKGGPLKQKNEKECALMFANIWMLQEPGVPEEIVSDEEKAFIANMFKELYSEYKISHLTTAPYHSKANGQVEVKNKMTREKFRILMLELNLDVKEWRSYLPLIYDKINRVKGVLGRSAYALTTGHHRISLAGEKPELEKEENEYAWYKRLMEERFEAMKKDALNRTTKEIKEETHLLQGDMVLIKEHGKKKAEPLYKGPFIVYKIVNQVTVHLYEEKSTGKVFTRHINDLVRYHGNSNQKIENKEYEIEKIIDKRKNGRKTEYLIRWRGFSEEHDQWLPTGKLAFAKDIVSEFNKNNNKDK